MEANLYDGYQTSLMEQHCNDPREASVLFTS